VLAFVIVLDLGSLTDEPMYVEALVQDVVANTPPTLLSNDTTLTLFFSETEHFHASDIFVEITASLPNARIFYTLDGSMPTVDSNMYVNPLRLRGGRTTSATVLRAIAVYEDEITRAKTFTYFIGEDVFDRFDTVVFSLSADPEHLFDHYVGILVPGALREEFVRANPGRHIIPTDPANFNWRGREEGERPVQIEVFYPNGNVCLCRRQGYVCLVHGHGLTTSVLCALLAGGNMNQLRADSIMTFSRRTLFRFIIV